MSYSSTIRGVLVYETEAKRDAVLEDIRDRGWTGETIRAATEEHDGDDKPAIHILRDRYRNLGRTLETMRESACDWLIVEASYEHGTPAGSVQTGPDGHEGYDLNEWAEENLIEPVSVYFESEIADEFVQAESLWEDQTELSLPTK